ncbi:MAG: Fe-S cluster assembly protein SufD [Anaerolineae bacterium]
MTIASSVSTTAGFGREAVAELSAAQGDTPWLQASRQAAWESFAAAELPRYERTDLSKFHFESFSLPVSAQGDLPDDVVAAIEGSDGGERAGLFVQSNNAVVHVALDPALAARGVILSSLADAARSHPALVEKHLGRLIPADETKFVALNAAFWTGGLFLYVPRNVIIESPIQVVFHADAPGGSAFPRCLVVAEESAACTMVEEYISADAASPMLTAPVTEVIAGENAQVKFIHVQSWGDSVQTFVTQRGEAAANALVGWTLGHIGAKLMRSTSETRLAGEGASTQFLGVQFGSDSQHHDIYTLLNHIAPLTDGDLLFRGVLQDTARSVFEGLIKIHPGAQDSNSYLHDNTLLLSDACRADSIPSLEIEANQVRASHGATVSQVDEDWIFYLQTRGLSRSEAIRTIVDAFFEPIMQRITLEGVKQRLWRAFDQKMGSRHFD